jgi:gluconolactonase
MAKFSEVATELMFPEGPIAMPDGSLLVVEIQGQRLTKITPGGEKRTIAEIRGGPNGAAIGPDGKVYVCNNGGFVYHHHKELGITMPAGAAADYSGGSIDRVDLETGKVETVYSAAGDIPLRGPNDIVFDEAGGFWFTDHGKTLPRARDRTGVFYGKADGSFIEEVIFPLENPNGIALSPDGKRLYVAETWTCQLWAFDIAEPGKISPAPGLLPHGGVFLQRPSGFKHYDSMAVDSAGNICVATVGDPSGIAVISPRGEEVDFIKTPDIFTTNICFGGHDLRTAFITLSGTGKVIAMEWPRPGAPLPFLERAVTSPGSVTDC